MICITNIFYDICNTEKQNLILQWNFFELLTFSEICLIEYKIVSIIFIAIFQGLLKAKTFYNKTKMT